jgi:hypothetical protein
MQKIRNITVAVPEELYRQTRRLAAENNHTVTEIVRYLLYCLPKALQAAPIPANSNASAPPDFARAFARAKKNGEPWPPPLQPVPAPKTSGFVRPQIGK